MLENCTTVAKYGFTRIMSGSPSRSMDSGRPISTGVADTVLTKGELPPSKRSYGAHRRPPAEKFRRQIEAG
jgi:hypothetical protein